MMSLKVIASRSFLQPVRVAETRTWDSRLFWGKWLLIMVLVTMLFSLTLTVAPFVHMDELVIVDLGRIMLHPQTDWSIAWIAERNQPAFFIFYLGPVLQEISYQLLGQYGPRIIALLGALLAATIVVKWLLVKGASRN